MRQEDELQDDALAIDEYGMAHPDSYGGVRFDSELFPEPVRLVAAFTRDLDRHLSALRSIVEHPDRVDVRSCAFSKHECTATAERVNQRVVAAIPDIGSLAVVDSIWSGTTVLVDHDHVEAVRQLLHEEPALRVDVGGYRPLSGP